MATYTKKLLSGSTNGKSIMVTGWTPGGAVNIHTAVAGTSSFDEVWIYAFNSSGSAMNLNLFWGGTTVNDTETFSLSAGRTLIADGRLLNNGLTVLATTTQTGTNMIQIDGFINSIV